MTGVTTGQVALPTATESDNVLDYARGGLTAALQALTNLFDSTTGHDHSGAGKGAPIGTAGIASGVTLSSPHFTSPVVDSGGLTVTGVSLFNNRIGIGTASITNVTLTISPQGLMFHGAPAPTAGYIGLSDTTGNGNAAAANVQANAHGTGSGPASVNVAGWFAVNIGTTAAWVPYAV